jgi:dihydrofolate reductase
MGKIVASENVSLDGVIEDPAGVEGFRRGGWFFETDRGEDGEKFTLDKMLGTEALLLGRRSYEFFAATWPSRGGELADKLNGMPKYVVSSILEDPAWNNSTVLAGGVVTEIAELKQTIDGEIVVLGSPQLARNLIEHDLVDELRLMIYPVVLGAGARLFGATGDKKPMRLVDTETVGDGIVILTYEPIRDSERASDDAGLQHRRAAALRQAGILDSA